MIYFDGNIWLEAITLSGIAFVSGKKKVVCPEVFVHVVNYWDTVLILRSYEIDSLKK